MNGIGTEQSQFIKEYEEKMRDLNISKKYLKNAMSFNESKIKSLENYNKTTNEKLKSSKSIC